MMVSQGFVYARPAYGRTYVSAADMLTAWQKDGKDFQIIGGPYLSVRDVPHLQASGMTTLVLLHDGGRMSVAIHYGMGGRVHLTRISEEGAICSEWTTLKEFCKT